MARHTLYAYVVGEVAGELVTRVAVEIARLINSVQWRYSTPRLVDQLEVEDSSPRADHLPSQELGLNIDLPDPPSEPEGWFDDIERIVRFLGDLHSRTGIKFVIGISDNERGYSEDLFWINSRAPNLGKLRQIIGVAG
jgi:hypothetical protein